MNGSPDSHGMMHDFRIVSHPPLKQLSVIPETLQEVSIVVSIFPGSTIEPDAAFDIHLCHVDAGSPQHAPCWPSVRLVQSEQQPVQLQHDDDNDGIRSTRTYSAVLRRPQPPGAHQLHRAFAFKYRNSAHEDWQWVHGSNGLEQGELIFRSWSPNDPLCANFELHPGWETTESETASAETRVFCTQSCEPIGLLNPSGGLNDRTLGRVREHSKYLAFCRIGPPWMGPRHGDYFFHLNEDAMVVSFLTKNGGVVTIAAPSLDDCCQVIRSDDHGGIVISARTDADPNQPFRVIISTAYDIKTSLDAIMTYLGREAASSDLSRRISEATSDLESECSGIASADWLDGLAFCTWNSIGQDLTEDKILKALRELRENNIPISTLLIDDNWQTLGPTLHDFSNPFFRGLVDFRADQTAFPDGLVGLVRAIRAENPLIRHIGVWHASLGYWGGIAERSHSDDSTPIRETYKTTLIPDATLFSSSFQPIPDLPFRTVSAADLPRFYDDFYGYLARSGVTFVKADVQCLLGGLRSSPERASLIPAYQAAQSAAGIRHFYLPSSSSRGTKGDDGGGGRGRGGGGGITTCMALTPELMWNALLLPPSHQGGKKPMVLRNSDDFFPDAPASAHPWHVWANAHNALLTSAGGAGEFGNAVLDWDMFQSGQGRFGAYHAAARCLSGGPLTITDVPGMQDRELLVERVLATATATAGYGDGRKSSTRRMVSLRPAVPGRTARGFDGYKESGVVRVVTRNGAAVGRGRAKMMGIFNVLEEEGVSLLVGAAEVVDFEEGKGEKEVVVFSYNTQRPYGLFRVEKDSAWGLGADSMIALDLPVDGFEIFTGHEVLSLPEQYGLIRYCVLGLLDRMTGSAAVCSVEGEWMQDQREAHVEVCLKAIGTLGLWVSGMVKKKPIKVILEGSPVDEDMVEVVALGSENDDQGGPLLVKIDILGMWSRLHRWDENRHETLVDIIFG